MLVCVAFLQARVGCAGITMSLNTLLSAPMLWPPTCALLIEVRGEASSTPPSYRRHNHPLMTFGKGTEANTGAAFCSAAVARCYNDHCDEATVRKHTAFQKSLKSGSIDLYPSVVSTLL